MLDDKIERVRAVMEPPWDEMHETRVLGRVLEARRQLDRKRRRGLISGAAAGGLAAAAAAVLALWPSPQVGPTATTEAAGATPDVAAEPVARAIEPPAGSTLTFSDGSRAELSAGAEVATEREQEGLLRVRQAAGRVRYEVVRDAERSFVVRCGHVEVRVLGTIFSVERVEGGVNVEVERGRVEVRDGERVVVLSRGDKLSVAAPEPGADEPPTAERPKAKKRTEPARPPSIEELMARADAARQLGRLPQAAEALAELVRHHGDDPRAVSALFTLGRVERARQRFAAAAQHFEACRRKSPSGPLAEDALAEAARSWQAAGESDKAARAAGRYLEQHPGGTHAARMRELLR